MKYGFIRILPGVFLLAGNALAAGVGDPFDTDALVPPRPVLYGPAAEGVMPCTAPQSAAPLALLEVVDLALCNNPQTREVWANARAQAAQVGVARAAYLPGLSGSVSASRNWTDTDGSRSPYDQNGTGLTLSYLLYDFGAREAALENARQLLAAASATQDSTVQAVFLAAVQAFYQAQANVSALFAAQESERASKESFSAAEARYKAGAATPADKLQAQTAWSQATLNRITAEGSQKSAQGALANVIGQDAHRPPSLVPAAEVTPGDAFERDVNALVEEARRRRPDLLAAEAQVRAAAANLNAVRAAGRPSISLAARSDLSNTDGSATSHGSSVGVTLTIPFFSGFAPAYRVRAAEAQADARGAQRDRIRLQVALDVWNAYHSLHTATQALRTSSDLLNSATQSEQVALGRYKAGVGSILDVLNAQSALASARQQRVQAALNWNVSRATLAQSMGNLDYGLLQTLPGVATSEEHKKP
ncbi:MAG: TolC family protein [Sulfuricella sp.]|jgi:TolC family type I secretion outer membrane protein